MPPDRVAASAQSTTAARRSHEPRATTTDERRRADPSRPPRSTQQGAALDVQHAAPDLLGGADRHSTDADRAGRYRWWRCPKPTIS
jgi:hypothetical protein